MNTSAIAFDTTGATPVKSLMPLFQKLENNQKCRIILEVNQWWGQKATEQSAG